MPLEGRDRSTSFWAFLRAFGVRWFVFMSGPLAVPFTFAALFVDSTWLKTLFALLAITCAAFACYWVWRHERQRKLALFEGVEQLEERLKPKLVFVMQECCRRHWSLGVVGVANPNPVTVEDARVYVSIPELQIDDRVVNWAGMGADENLDIHQAPLSRHHHTSCFVSAGDSPGQFFLHPAYGPAQTIEAGRYVAELCVRGRNATATIARVEIICALPHSLTVRLVPEGEDA